MYIPKLHPEKFWILGWTQKLSWKPRNPVPWPSNLGKPRTDRHQTVTLGMCSVSGTGRHHANRTSTTQTQDMVTIMHPFSPKLDYSNFLRVSCAFLVPTCSLPGRPPVYPPLMKSHLSSRLFQFSLTSLCEALLCAWYCVWPGGIWRITYFRLNLPGSWGLRQPLLCIVNLAPVRHLFCTMCLLLCSALPD